MSSVWNVIWQVIKWVLSVLWHLIELIFKIVFDFISLIQSLFSSILFFLPDQIVGMVMLAILVVIVFRIYKLIRG